MDLVFEIKQKNDELTQSIRLLRKNGEELANREKEYKIKLCQEALKLRQDKKMPVTLIDQIIYGMPEVAKLRFERDVAGAMYEANKEHINVVKLQIRLLENQIQREFSVTGRDNF